MSLLSPYVEGTIAPSTATAMKLHGGRRWLSAEYCGQITMALLESVRGVVDVEDLIQDVANRQRRTCCEIRPLSATRSQTSSVRRGDVKVIAPTIINGEINGDQHRKAKIPCHARRLSVRMAARRVRAAVCHAGHRLPF